MINIYYRYKSFIWIGLVLFLALSILLYSFQILESVRQQQARRSFAELVARAPEVLTKQTDSIRYLEAQLAAQQKGSLSILSHNDFIRTIEQSSRDADIRIISIPSETLETNENYKLARVSMKLEGSYKDMLRFLYVIENQKKLGRILFADIKVEEFNNNLEIKDYLTLQLTLVRLISSDSSPR